MSEFRYTCARAQKDLVDLVGILREEEILQVTPDDDYLRQCISSCPPCRKKGKPKNCCGWRTVVERGVLSFGPLTHPANKQIRIELSASCDYRRSQPGRRSAWDERPLTTSGIALEIFSIEADELLERHHLDLANAGPPAQAGPVWHLQVGGNPAGSQAPTSTSWLDVPRWPAAPMDLTLAIEFVAYSFFPDKWSHLNERGDWLRLMKGAEQLVVSHFAAVMEAHFLRDADNRDRTWLAAQDNGSTAYNPRPPLS